MLVRVFDVDGKEIDLKTTKKPPRVLNPFELGFHEAVLGKDLNDNPFTPYTTAADEWDSGFNIYKERKRRMLWINPKEYLPLETNVELGRTYLCLVQDKDGYFLHKPCKTRGPLFSGAVIWEDYENGIKERVIEFSQVPMKNPHRVNAMQANLNWAAM